MNDFKNKFKNKILIIIVSCKSILISLPNKMSLDWEDVKIKMNKKLY